MISADITKLILTFSTDMFYPVINHLSEIIISLENDQDNLFISQN
jgi:hypothetical protein